jgi:hypothetical protein
MEGSRRRTLLGIALVLVGGALLFRALLAPIVTGNVSALDQQHEMWREQQQAQIEMRRAELEIQRELELSKLEAQRELQLAEREAQRAHIEAQRELQEQLPGASGGALDTAPIPELPPLPPMPELPPLPPVPPAPQAFHLGIWPSPTVALVGLLILLLWWRGRGERAPRQV